MGCSDESTRGVNLCHCKGLVASRSISHAPYISLAVTITLGLQCSAREPCVKCRAGQNPRAAFPGASLATFCLTGHAIDNDSTSYACGMVAFIEDAMPL